MATPRCTPTSARSTTCVELAAAARAHGLDLALDLAFQCSPDHPWVTEHPEWFRHRPDGTIQYAENPPKKYQDIYPLDFECADVARRCGTRCSTSPCSGSTTACAVFRVDNPHTKPFPFWEWLIAEVQQRHPGTIFLAEAFTRPAVMHRLGQVGFTQGYTYFTWRESKQELIDYFIELASPPSVDEFRPNVWPTTPDILPAHLQHAPLEAFALRVVLAATLSPSYGVLRPHLRAGRERAVRPARRQRQGGAGPTPRSTRCATGTWPGARSLRPLLAELNRHPPRAARAAHVAHAALPRRRQRRAARATRRPRTPARRSTPTGPARRRC